ncbi:DUF4097 and DUF4098 domain-containing protein YvlB [Salirhabdus euzebyi]|uniref:DUF4097 and DUF4098 domain-containing protein YvlB n=1 Tax=Salirhabdus euzebyi TaxID=394506 RepID=A0A841Q605_9BACI|nr:DUF4097 family beta strand repeat-containing protein [Salirhabdus euzebyi]MBB6453815.1 DUF4097 and DUF4098 domain-containing protein YvlB [Salirhabdus euzebyi]
MKKVVIGALIVLIIGIIGTVSLGGSIFALGPKVDINERQSFDAEEIESVKIKSNVGDVRIFESDSNEIEVHIHGEVSKQNENKSTFEITQEGNTLQVTSDIHSKQFFSIPFINFNMNDKQYIDVSIPKGLLSYVEVESDVGKIDIEEIEVTELFVSNDVGEVGIDKFVGEKATIRTNVGKVNVKSAVGKIEIESDTGEVELTMEAITEDVNIKSDIGEVVVNVKELSESLVLDLDSDIGDIDVNGPFVTNGNGPGPTLKVRTDIGEIEVNH